MFMPCVLLLRLYFFFFHGGDVRVAFWVMVASLVPSSSSDADGVEVFFQECLQRSLGIASIRDWGHHLAVLAYV